MAIIDLDLTEEKISCCQGIKYQVKLFTYTDIYKKTHYKTSFDTLGVCKGCNSCNVCRQELLEFYDAVT